MKHANFSDCEFITKFHASCTPNLETLDLSSCQNLVEFDASCTPNLETLDLSFCKNLVEIDASVGLLKKLKTCNLSYCSKLQFLPSQLRFKSLNSFYLRDCPEKFPEIHPEMECLKVLILSLSGIKLKLACNSLDGFCMMRKLILYNCENIVEYFFLRGFRFENLKHANFRDCEFITKFHASCTPNLETLNLSSCKNLVEIDASVGLLQKLKEWDLSSCEKLQFLPSQLRLKSLFSFNLTGCQRLEKFPEIHPEMERLGILILSSSGIKIITILESLRLGLLFVDNCKQLREIQGVPQSIRNVHARDCMLLDTQPLLNQVCFSFFLFLS